ncbi:MAG: type II toxin-antitoxin system RelE/ParE family toxin [Planctomycetes bacterium]|nr:type II toxin-antitoxin system RelE/ParE family toxin [Planctomycetota bacterium]
MHEVRVGRSATKELEGLPQQVLTRIANKIDGLATDPRPSGARKLRGADDLWRVRVGDYRIVYAVDDDAATVEIRVIRHRKDAYGPS